MPDTTDPDPRPATPPSLPTIYRTPVWMVHPGHAEFVAEVRAAQGRTTYPTDAVVVC